jgi:hypothetical protein
MAIAKAHNGAILRQAGCLPILSAFESGELNDKRQELKGLRREH